MPNPPPPGEHARAGLPHWQLPGRRAVPVHKNGHLLGVVFVDAGREDSQGFAGEGMQAALAPHLEAALAAAHAKYAPQPPAAQAVTRERDGDSLRVRRIGASHSIFVNGYYLIKGVAGAALWRLLHDHVHRGQDEFSMRDLRVALSVSVVLPAIDDNLGVRVLLLRQRLKEHSAYLRIERTGRGRYRLVVLRPVELIDG